MNTTTTPKVRLKTSRQPHQFVAFVTINSNDETRVKFKRLPPVTNRNHQWTCDEHGKHMFATCAHEKAALVEYRKTRRND